MNIKVEHNTGIISAGNYAQNAVTYTNTIGSEEIEWDRLLQDIELLKASDENSIRLFAEESADAIKNRDTGKVKAWLSKWIPCISGLIETSYYVIEIAARFGIIN